jgi:muramoyltetrapeptide carboxypeptidase
VSVPELTRPRRLAQGDRVAVVAPGGPVPKDRLDRGCAILRRWGLDVVVAPHVTDVHDRLEYLAGTDPDRAADLQSAWLDPSMTGIFCARGGYGVQRILDLLDWSSMRDTDAKVLAGFSDVTALHEAFATQLGVATLHAPMVAARSFVSDEPTAEHLRRTLFEPESVMTLTSPTAETLLPGRARGVTVGGCVSLLADEIGTPTARSGVDGGLLVLEDLEEELYRLDRIFTQLLRSGWMNGVAGIALGSWVDCEPADRMRDLVLDRFGGLGVPIVWELGFGHCPSTLTVPLGVPATLDADAATLTMDVPALAR